jgi:hypothetical protein
MKVIDATLPKMTITNWNAIQLKLHHLGIVKKNDIAIKT